MSLQFILGNSGSGKSHYLYQQIVNESMEHPEKNYLVLVPEQFTMQTQRDLCAAHPRGGIMNIDALSFMRLAYRVFEEVGREEQPVLDDEGKNLVIRRIAGKLEDDLKVLKGNLKKQGYISEVKSVISEFVQYGVDFDKLDDFMEGLSQESYLYYKLQDIRKVYEGFEEYLRDRYITKEEMLDVLARAVCDSELLKGSVIALDGFTGFTPVQIRLISELLKVSEKVIVTVEIDRREDPFIYRHPYQLFALSKQMVTSLVKTAQDAGAEVEEPVCLYEKVPYRFRENPEMAFLESELFRYSRRQYKKKKEEFWALNNVDIKVKKGEVIGFIGANGAGKSTLLKIVAGVMKPTKGHVDVYGNICPMIELGAGFDPQLTARENIYLNGAVMGYSKELINAKFDEIVEFSELRNFLDVPVQNFSSGMVARLAFSIATIVEPEILIVDEILSVGDIAFQKKSEEKMLSMINGGTTVLFVSHSIKQIKKLCDKIVWLEHGEVKEIGKKEVCDKYEEFMEGR